uniref:Odorant receptor n=1 Tax=Campoletis chlorideae TaxID=219166 RepID=A0A346D3W2_9HYME|nr:odorant receptor [Campoletis chlorideae]
MPEETANSNGDGSDRGMVIESDKEYLKSMRTNGNPLSKKDYQYTTQMNRYFLKPIGMWPTRPEAGICEKILIQIQRCCCYFLMFFLLVACVLHKFLVEKDPAIQLKMIGPISFCLMAIMKFSFLVFHRHDIYDCFKHIALDWASVESSSEREIMLNDAKFGRFLASLCAGFMYGGGFFYHTIMPLSSGVIVTPDNKTLRLLTHPVYDPFFDAQTSPTYEIVVVTHWCSAFVLYTVTIGACSIAAVFAIHACGQFKVVVSRLNHLVDGDDEKRDTVDERMANIVELHLRTLNFVNNLEGVLNEVCLVEFIGCTMNICFLGYYFMSEWENSETISTVTYCVLFVSFTFNIFIFCYIGEKLTEESKHVGTMTYMIEWYRLHHTKAQGLILILIISKYPARITAGKMAELSMTCFSNVLKTAFTYLNLLRTVAS